MHSDRRGTAVATLDRPQADPHVRTNEFLILAAATAATWLHTIDELRIGEYVAVPFGAANVAFVAAWSGLGARSRAVGAIAFGLLWSLAVVPYHVLPLVGGTVTGQHVSGLSRLVGGAAMIGVGVAVALRRREPH